MKALITGCNGFVGKYLTRELVEAGHTVHGLGQGPFNLGRRADDVPERASRVARSTSSAPATSSAARREAEDSAGVRNARGAQPDARHDVSYEEVDILDAQALRRCVENICPDWVFHLAGIASVQYSWQEPGKTFAVNVLGTVNLVRALAGTGVQAILQIGSSEVYGPGKTLEVKFDEESCPNPQSPYATSKYAAERSALQLGLKLGLPVLAVRPFNHIGPGQAEGFVIPDFAREIVRAARSQGSVRTGRLDVYRDFTDVRDVVRAYRFLAERGSVGEVYNVCSGRATPLSDVLGKMLQVYGDLPVMPDAGKMRPTENIYSVGDPGKIRGTTGWEPVYPLEQSLNDVLAEWERRLRDQGDLS
ncbi:GDP-6-deoxy-D-mannose reductase [Peptococcaceae bacterium CEB3]|nr:GDP-6-deoxy-D-mannose reductase [Peptococcaceae bacterium CEB3]